MKKLTRWMESIFHPKTMQGLDVVDLLDSMNDPVIRKTWLWDVFEELKRLNLAVDKSLQEGGFRIEDLAAKRKAYQEILEGILVAKRTVKSKGPNPRTEAGEFDLDSVTVQTSPFR